MTWARARRAAVTWLTAASLVLAAIATFGPLTTAFAAPTTLTVDNTSDFHGTLATACAAGDGHCGLREAIEVANNLAAGGSAVTIGVGAGTYNLTLGELQVGTLAGDSIQLNGAGAGTTTIQASGSRVFNLDPGTVGAVTVGIAGVTISGGSPSLLGGAGLIGGSVNGRAADLTTLQNCAISGNTVGGTATNTPGGGIQYGHGNLTIDQCVISGNNAGTSSGGGIAYMDFEAAGKAGTLTITDSTISGNTASAALNGGGGGIFVEGASASFSITNSTLSGNSATGNPDGSGGGAGILKESGTLTIGSSTFLSNQATVNGAGGGIYSVSGNTTVPSRAWPVTPVDPQPAMWPGSAPTLEPSTSRTTGGAPTPALGSALTEPRRRPGWCSGSPPCSPACCPARRTA
jgi:hypothetical protein